MFLMNLIFTDEVLPASGKINTLFPWLPLSVQVVIIYPVLVEPETVIIIVPVLLKLGLYDINSMFTSENSGSFGLEQPKTITDKRISIFFME